MILTCPECQTQYGIPDGAIKPEGRKVKCVSCGHVWHQMPMEDEPEVQATSETGTSSDKGDVSDDSTQKQPASQLADNSEDATSGTPDDTPDAMGEVTNIPANAQTPAITPTQPVSRYLKLACVLCILLAIAASVVKLEMAAGLLGQINYDDVVINDFAIKKTRAPEGWNFDFSVEVKNLAQVARPLPPVQIIVMSKGGREMNRALLSNDDNILLEPGDSYSYDNILTNVSGNADRLFFDIGNSWELWFR